MLLVEYHKKSITMTTLESLQVRQLFDRNFINLPRLRDVSTLSGRMPSSVPWSWSALLPPTSSLTFFSSSEPAAEWGWSDEWCQNLFDIWQLYECFISADVFYFPGFYSRCFRSSSSAAPLSSLSLFSAPTFSSRYYLGTLKPCYWQCLPTSGPVPLLSALVLGAHLPSAGRHECLAHCAGCLLGPGGQGKLHILWQKMAQRRTMPFT